MTSNFSPVSVTSSAARRINQIIAKDANARMLRISVSAGGCSGFQYEYLLVESGSPTTSSSRRTARPC